MLGKMKASLDAALKKSLEEGNTNADIEALKKLAQRRRLEKIKATIQVTKDVTAVLEDPPLPSAADLERWWPEPKQTFVMNPLVTYGTLAGHELEMLRLHEERRRATPQQSLTANETTEPIVLPQAPYLPVSPRAAGGDGISPNRSKRQLKYPMLQIQIQTPRSNSELLNAPLTAPLSPREGTGTTGLNHLTSSNLAGQAPLTSSSIGAPGLQAQVSYTSSIGGQALLRPQSRPGTLESGRPRSSTWGSSMSRSRSPTQGKRPSLSHSPRRAPSRLDPSRAFGNPTTIVLPEDEDDTKDAFNLERFIGAVGRPGERRPDSPPSFMRPGDTTLQLETIDRSNRLTHWMEVFQADEEAFASKAVFVEMRLRQALSSSVQLGTPNAFRTAIVCDAFERVAPMTGRYQGVLELCWKELMQSIFLDYSPDLPGTGAKVYAERTPYFLEVKRLRDLTEEQNKTMKRMKMQRDAELAEIQARNQLINKVADKWNKALAGSQASKEADALKLRVESMQQLLGDAQREVQKMHHEQYKEPMQKLVEAYQMCEDHERESVLIEHIFPSPSAASVWTTVTPDQAALWIIQFFSKLKPASLAGPKEATRGRVLESLFTVMNLPPDEKLPLAVSLLATHYDARQVGETLANVMIAKASESVLATDSKVPLYRQSIHGFVDELDSSNPDDPRATVKHQVVLELKKCLGVLSSNAPEPTRQQYDMSLPPMPPKSVSFGAKAGLPTSAAAAAAEAAAIRDKIADLKRRQALGLLTPEEEAELRALEARLAQLDEVVSGGGKGSKRKPGQSDADRMADLLRRQAAGELTPEEAAELARLQAKNPDAAEAARLADLKRRQKLGQLTPEEEAELRRLEAKLGGIPTDPKARAAEEAAVRDRIADLKRRQALGQLTPEEEAELRALEAKLKKLEDANAADRMAALKKKKPLSPEEEAELRALEAKMAGRGYGGSGSGNGRDVACQTDGDLGSPSLKRQGTMGGSMQDVSGIGGTGGMPDRAVTSLCEIKFNRKDVKAMNTLMCRRILSALYQVKIEANDEADKQKRPRQSFPDFVPDQFVVLYGIKSLAIKNINEFLYGVRAERYRKDEKANLTEPEPLLMPFWQGSWHGVPQQERMPMEMFEFYLDVLAGVAKTVSEEHTLQLKGVGAFWNMLGSMNEISIPVFVLINCITKMFEKSHKDLFERIKQGVLRLASVNLKEKQKRDKEGKPKPFPSYKEAILGKEGLDSRGHVAVHQFLNLALDSDKKQTEKDSKFLDDAYQTWVAFKKENTYEVFVECLKESSPELPDADVINLYNLATSGDNPDVPDFKLICKTLRAKDIHLVRKGGAESISKQKIDDLKTMTKMTRLFVDKTPDNVDDPRPAPEPQQSEDAGTEGGDSGAPGEVSKTKSWRMAKSVAMFSAAATTKRNIRALMQEMEMAEAEEQ